MNSTLFSSGLQTGVVRWSESSFLQNDFGALITEQSKWKTWNKPLAFSVHGVGYSPFYLLL